MQIKIPYTTRPAMSRLTSGSAFLLSPNANVVAKKQQELEILDTELWAQLPDSGDLIRQACRKTGKTETANIREFALQFQEDVAILQHGVLAAVCFCFPSSWRPAHMIGKTLAEIHGGVADGDHLRAQSARIAKTISDPVLGSFERWVWTVTVSPHLSNHPLRRLDIVPKSRDDLYFRTERQTTLPLDDGASCVFFVDVSVQPLNTVWEIYGKQIRESIASMTPAVLEYKNLKNVAHVLEINM